MSVAEYVTGYESGMVQVEIFGRIAREQIIREEPMERSFAVKEGELIQVGISRKFRLEEFIRHRQRSRTGKLPWCSTALVSLDFSVSAYIIAVKCASRPAQSCRNERLRRDRHRPWDARRAQYRVCLPKVASVFLKGGTSCQGILMQLSSGPARQARLWLRDLRLRA